MFKEKWQIPTGLFCPSQHIVQASLGGNAVQTVRSTTIQQRQSFDDFFASDQERLHNYADYLTQHNYDSPEELQQMLMLFKEPDTECIAMCLDDSWVCGRMHSDILRLGKQELTPYRILSGSGIRENYIGPFSGTPKFSYYEAFTFSNGHKGLIQKAYDRSKILETFTLSLYDGQGYGYIMDQTGDILLRSVPATSSLVYSNVFDALTDTHSPQEDIGALAAALEARETGSIIFDGDSGRFIYTYPPLECVDNWHLLSVVPENAINTESDAILRYSQTSLAILAVILFICILFTVLIWRAQRDIEAPDHPTGDPPDR